MKSNHVEVVCQHLKNNQSSHTHTHTHTHIQTQKKKIFFFLKYFKNISQYHWSLWENI